MRILYVTTISKTINAFMIPHIQLLLNQGHHVDIACNINEKISPKLLDRCNIFNIEFQRSPLKIKNYIAYNELKKIIKNENYDLIHTHTPIASVCVRLACRKMSNVKVLYTAHGFHFFKGAPLINWLIYYPIEKWLSKYTNILITINKEDYERAKKSFKSGKVEYIPGVGLDTKKYKDTVVDKIAKRREIGVQEDAFVVLSVGELNRNKNHEIIIKAISLLNNSNIHYVICGEGPLENNQKNLARKLNLEKQVHFLGHRNDVGEICKASDLFAFPSKREGLGLAALEAMASGLPIVTSNLHGITDYSVDGITGYTCKPIDVNEFSKAISYLIKNKDLREKMGKYNMNAVKLFDLDNVLIEIKRIYKNIIT